jgi:hypothetical protein
MEVKEMTYQKLVERVKNMTEADADKQVVVSPEPKRNGSYHEIDKERHELLNYSYVLYGDPGLEVEYRWNMCHQCQQLRNKKILVWDNNEQRVFEKRIIHHGERQDRRLTDKPNPKLPADIKSTVDMYSGDIG